MQHVPAPEGLHPTQDSSAPRLMIVEDEFVVASDLCDTLEALGYSVVEPYRVANKFDTIYDLASLTKPLITAMLCSRRIELGELTLDSSISHYLAEFDRTDKQMITVRELLTHTSGLPAWRPLYLLTEDEPERAAGAIANLDLEYKPGTRVVYSDLGFIALGILLERLTGHRLAEMAKHEIFAPWPGFAEASVWLLGAGLIMAALAAVAGLTDFLGDPQVRGLNDAWWHAGGNVVAVVIELINWFLRYMQGSAAVLPTGIILSAVVVVILLFTGWKGWELVYRYRVGVSDDVGSSAP